MASKTIPYPDAIHRAGERAVRQAMDEFKQTQIILFRKEEEEKKKRKDAEENLATTIIAMERAALEEWNRGNPTGYLDIYAEDITYFDPIQRINGVEKIKELYESIRGQVQVEKYEIIDPVVQISGKTVVLGYNLVSCSGEKIYHWNCTEVYQQRPDTQWKIIHSHWSLGKTE